MNYTLIRLHAHTYMRIYAPPHPLMLFDAISSHLVGVAVKVSYDAGGWEIAPDKLEYIESKQKKRTNKDKDRADAEHHFDDYFNDMCEDDNEDEYDENGHKIKKPKTSKVGFSGKDKTDPGSVINAMFGGANNLAIINTSDEVMGLLTPEGRVRVQHTVDRMTDLAREMKELERCVCAICNTAMCSAWFLFFFLCLSGLIYMFNNVFCVCVRAVEESTCVTSSSASRAPSRTCSTSPSLRPLPPLRPQLR